ncbi:hypothetical protein QNI15_15595 [Cytophagaceae bacterium NT2B1]|nr:glycosyl hydrolase family 65 protein [Xanthocytophaga flavus]MDJ1469273.1 hypothetical protein [Xanthocytophaga flavus]
MVHPLLPEHEWNYYCLDNVRYKNKTLTIYYDKTGKQYNQKKGYYILVDGKVVFESTKPKDAIIKLGL